MIKRQEATNDLVQMAKENDGKLVDLLEAVTLINKIYDSRGTCFECAYWVEEAYGKCMITGTCHHKDFFCGSFGQVRTEVSKK